jgi:hypothetical protein
VPAPFFVKLPVPIIGAEFDKVKILATEFTSIVEATLLIVKALFVVAVLPVYSKVPAPITKLVATLVALPIPEAIPPSATVAILSTPELIVVTPV